MSLLNVESYVFINVFYLVLFCIHVCVLFVSCLYLSACTLRRKDNQAMKFGQLVEYNKINIFLQRPCRS